MAMKTSYTTPWDTIKMDGRSIGWWWPHLDMSPTGESLADRNCPSTTVTTMPFHEVVRRRLEFSEREEGALAQYELSDIIETVRYFGRYRVGHTLVKPSGNKEEDVEFGFEIVSMDDQARIEWFAEYYRIIASPELLRKGIWAASGSLDYWSEDRKNNLLLQSIFHSQYEGFAKVGTLGRKRAKQAFQRSERTLKEVAAELNLRPKLLSKFVRRLNVLPDAKWNGDALSFNKEAFQRVKDAVADLITLPQTIEISGVPGHEFRMLASQGFLQEFNLPVNGVAGPKYFRSEVVEIVNRIVGSTERKPEKGMTKLFSYAKAHGIKQGRVLVMMATGNLHPAAVDRTRDGFRGIYFACEDSSVADNVAASCGSPG